MTLVRTAARGTGLASQNGLTRKPYLRFGNPDYDPAAVPRSPQAGVTPAQKRAEAEERRARFAQLREQEGKTPAEAAEVLGISAETARKYETKRRAALGGEPA